MAGLVPAMTSYMDYQTVGWAKRTVPTLPPQYRDHAIGEGQTFGHHRDEIGQQLLAERRIIGLDRFELIGAEHVESARDFGLDGCVAWRTRDQAHLADRRIAAEASHTRGAALIARNHDADASLQNEMHGVGGLARADNGLAGLDLDALAAVHQRRGVTLGAEDLGEPVAQRGLLLFDDAMLRNDLVLAPLQRMVQFGNDAHLVRDEFARS